MKIARFARNMLKVLVLSVSAAFLGAISTVACAAESAVVIVSHEVADFAAWKARFDAGKGNRSAAGMTDRYVMRDLSKPNTVIVVLEGSVESAKKFVADPGFQDRVKKASSTGTAEIRIAVKP